MFIVCKFHAHDAASLKEHWTPEGKLKCFCVFYVNISFMALYN